MSQLNIRNMFTAEELQQAEELDRFQRQRAAKARAKALRGAKGSKKLLPYTFHGDESKLPKVGESVAVCHRTEVNHHGDSKLTRSAVDFSTIKRVYLSDDDGYRVMVTSGDVWLVRPAAQGSAKWETFRPGEKQLTLVK